MSLLGGMGYFQLGEDNEDIGGIIALLTSKDGYREQRRQREVKGVNSHCLVLSSPGLSVKDDRKTSLLIMKPMTTMVVDRLRE